MNDQELKRLTTGDEIFVRATYCKTDGAGDIHFCVKYRCGGLVEDTIYALPENVFFRSDLQQPAENPKYDPCRKFRKGDIVRLREYNGRKPYDFWHKQTIKHFGAKLDTVYEDEKEDSGHVDIYQDAPIDELMVRVHASYLELVTPVEELEPYCVGESTDYFSVDKDDEELCLFWKDKHPHAKKSAEDERDRLNAEYRKGEADNGGIL